MVVVSAGPTGDRQRVVVGSLLVSGIPGRSSWLEHTYPADLRLRRRGGGRRWVARHDRHSVPGQVCAAGVTDEHSGTARGRTIRNGPIRFAMASL